MHDMRREFTGPHDLRGLTPPPADATGVHDMRREFTGPHDLRGLAAPGDGRRAAPPESAMEATGTYDMRGEFGDPDFNPNRPRRNDLNPETSTFLTSDEGYDPADDWDLDKPFRTGKVKLRRSSAERAQHGDALAGRAGVDPAAETGLIGAPGRRDGDRRAPHGDVLRDGTRDGRRGAVARDDRHGDPHTDDSHDHRDDRDHNHGRADGDGRRPGRDGRPAGRNSRDARGAGSSDAAGPGATRLREKKARSRRRLGTAAKLGSAGVAAAVLIVAGVVWGAKQWADEQFRPVAALDLTSNAIVDPASQQGDENLLLVGSDSRDTGDGGAQGDTIMLAHLPADRSRAVVLSFPRDLEVDRPACTGWDPATGEPTGARDPGATGVPIRTVYPAGGPKCVTAVVQQLTGLRVSRFLAVDFAGFRSMVDTADGVEMCVEQPIQDATLGPVVASAGDVDLTGQQALDFVRAREVVGDPPSDQGRLRRQQQFIAAMARETLSASVLTDTDRLATFVEAMAGNTFADGIDVDELARLGTAVQGLDPSRITFVTVPTDGVLNERGNDALRAAEATALFRALVDDTPLPGSTAPGGSAQPQAPPSSDAPVSVPPDQVKVQVVNGTSEDGLANTVARDLREAGFVVVSVGSGGPQPQTVVRYGAAGEAAARTVAAAIPGAALQLDASMGGAIRVVLGDGFDGVVRPVQVGDPVGVRPGAAPQPAPGTAPIPLATVNGADTSCA